MDKSKLEELKASIKKSRETVAKGVRCSRTGCNGIIDMIDGFGAGLRWKRLESGSWTLGISDPARWIFYCSVERKHYLTFTDKDLTEDFRRFLYCGVISYKPGRQADLEMLKPKIH